MNSSKTQWTASVTAALFVHAALASYFYEPPVEEGALGAGEAGVEISIGLAGTYTEPTPEPEMPAEPEPAPEPEPDIEPEAKIEPEILPETEVIVQPEPLKLPEPLVEPPAMIQTVSIEAEPVTTALPDPLISTPEVNVQHATGFAELEATGGNPAARQSYFSHLTAWLNKYKEYPLRAKRRRMTGIVKVKFTIDRNGSLLASEIVDDSQYALLNETALETLKKADPYPPIPENMEMNELTITLPVEFTLKR